MPKSYKKINGVEIITPSTDLSYVSEASSGTIFSSTGNDATIPLADITNAGLLSPSEKSKINNLSGVNTGDETTSSIQAKRPLKTIEGQSLEGTGNIDLNKSDVGLSSVDNVADINKPISNATQTALDIKENLSNKQNSLVVDGTGIKYPTVDAVNAGINSSSNWNRNGNNIYNSNSGNVGINVVNPGELFHLGDGNMLLEGGGEVAQKFKRDFTTSGERLGVPTGSGQSVNPIFSIGRIIEAGDGDPELRIMYSDDNTTYRKNRVYRLSRTCWYS